MKEIDITYSVPLILSASYMSIICAWRKPRAQYGLLYRNLELFKRYLRKQLCIKIPESTHFQRNDLYYTILVMQPSILPLGGCIKS
jgi:hypothetical protein